MIRGTLTVLLSLSLSVLVLSSATIKVAGGDAALYTFDVGEVYLYGNHVPPPYTLAVTDTALLLNGVPIYPKIRLSADRSDTITVRPEIHEQSLLISLARDLERRLRKEGKSPREITAAVVEFFRASPIVAAVSGLAHESFDISWTHPKLGTTRYLVSIEDPPPAIPLAERIEAEAQQYLHCFALDCLIVISTSANIYAPSKADRERAALREEIRRAQTTDRAALEAGVWSGRYLSLSMAREFRDPLPLYGGGGR